MSEVVHPLNVQLSLNRAGADLCDAIVTVTVTDTGYRAGELRRGLPPGIEGFPDVEYLSFYFRHENELCGEIVREVTRSQQIPVTSDKRDVVACAVVNGKLAGHASAPLPDAALVDREFV
jgi:hypothetical protein